MQHISFFSLVRLASSLSQLINNEKLIISDCFSQNKDELILEFSNSLTTIYWRVCCSPDFPFILPEYQLKRARHNSITLFEGVLQLPILRITVPTNERCILFYFDNQLVLSLKMFGKHENVLVFDSGRVSDCFRKKITADWDAQLPTHSQTAVAIQDKQLKQYVNDLVHQGLSEEIATEDVINQCLTGSVFILQQPTDVQFWLIKPNENQREFQDFQKGLEAFVREKFRIKRFSALYQQTASELKHEKNRIESRIQYSEKQLVIMNKFSYELFGNLILAHLPQIQPMQTTLSTWNFEGTDQIEIPLKCELDAVTNAQRYFQKSKHQRAQLERINNQLEADINRLWSIESALKELEKCTNILMIRSLRNRFHQLFQEKVHFENAEILPFRKYEYAGYTILVGKNAAANDKLTVQYAHKDDLWLHARDVSGSHVVIRRLPGRTFSTLIIEYAAGLAVFFSKNRNATLAPVSYTFKKYVRKHKGHLPGQVTLAREDVILVPPVSPKSSS